MWPMFTIKPPSVQNTVHVMFFQAKRHVVMVRLRVLSSWLPKHKGFARRYACESCHGFRVTSEVTSSVNIRFHTGIITMERRIWRQWFFSWTFESQIRCVLSPQKNTQTSYLSYPWRSVLPRRLGWSAHRSVECDSETLDNLRWLEGWSLGGLSGQEKHSS